MAETDNRTTGRAAGPFARPGPHLVIPEFLGAETASQLLALAAERQADFQPSRIGPQGGTGSEDPGFRISSRLEPGPGLESLVHDRVRSHLGGIFAALGIPAFEPSGWEVELVAHGHGAFFKRHVDTSVGSPDQPGGPARSMRVVSLVYYFFRQPQRFHGGALRLHALAAPGTPGSFVDIVPVNDRAVAFPFWFPHEVLPVSCEGGDFLDSRFAINCWLYK